MQCIYLHGVVGVSLITRMYMFRELGLFVHVVVVVNNQPYSSLVGSLSPVEAVINEYGQSPKQDGELGLRDVPLPNMLPPNFEYMVCFRARDPWVCSFRV